MLVKLGMKYYPTYRHLFRIQTLSTNFIPRSWYTI